MREEYINLFDAVLQCSVGLVTLSAPTLLNGALSILSSLFPLFGDFPDRISTMLNHVIFIYKSICINFLFQLKSILLIDNPNNQDIEITATKRHSIALLLKIVSMFPVVVKVQYYYKILMDILLFKISLTHDIIF